MKNAVWVAPGYNTFNLGDVLLYTVTKEYFSDKVELILSPTNRVLDENFIRKSKNLIIGPGGILVGTAGARILYEKVINDASLKMLDGYGIKFHVWSSGILHEPDEKQRKLSTEILTRSRFISTRARIEIENIKKIAPTSNPLFAPCATLFMDRIFRGQLSEHQKSDIVVLNIPDNYFDGNMYLRNPFMRFVDYARSEGLQCVLMSNCANNDTSLDMLRNFNLLQRDSTLESILIDYYEALSKDKDSYPFSKLSTTIRKWGSENSDSMPGRYDNCRFAFGRRLHGWLPFFSFDIPSAFLGIQARRGMPFDYFGNDDFLCKVPTKAENIQDLHSIADGMIEKLKFFITNETLLSARIAARREELWETFQLCAAKLVDSLE
ncbi:MAG: polysaccharide pyruvyl transferase family protein [Eggerthellaceae bacterium]|nr:polysaccharide pyruvyl transferase family protein [Eggerthellaceae bacterium]